MDPKTLLLTCRNTENLIDSLPKKAVICPLDLSAFDSVKALVQDILEHHQDLDTVVANAAKATQIYSQTQDGWESSLQVNYLSNALLCILLLPRLLGQPSPTRIALVSSDGHVFIDQSKLPKEGNILEALNAPQYCASLSAMKDRYNVTKVLLLMFAKELSARADTRLAVMSINPGFCYSNLTREAESRFSSKWLIRFFKWLLGRSTEMGSRTIVHSVVEPEPHKFRGRYVSVCELSMESDYISSSDGVRFFKTALG
ncbi:hypothetical protein C8J56DRAFT_371052 [Mycena floridula]|nr:hypothetical protein C8J56DRAFT_371052 [Mycena floridula]